MRPDVNFIPLGPAIGFARDKKGRRGAAVAGMNVLCHPHAVLTAQAVVQGYQAAIRDMEGAERVAGFKPSAEKKAEVVEVKQERKGRLTRFVDAKEEHEEAEKILLGALKEHLGDEKNDGRPTEAKTEAEKYAVSETKASSSSAAKSGFTKASTADFSAKTKSRGSASNHGGSKSSKSPSKQTHENSKSGNDDSRIRHGDHSAKHGRAQSASTSTRSSSISSLSCPMVRHSRDGKEHHHRRRSRSTSRSDTSAESGCRPRIDELETALLAQHRALLQQQQQQQRPQHPSIRSPFITTPDGRVVQSPHLAAPPRYPSSAHPQHAQHQALNTTQQGQHGAYYYSHYSSEPQHPQPLPAQPGWGARLGRGEPGRGASARTALQEMMDGAREGRGRRAGQGQAGWMRA